MFNSASRGDSEKLRDLSDRFEIAELIYRYVDGVHENDPNIITSVFADDALLAFPRGPVQGRDDIQAYFAGGLGADKAKRMGLDALLDVAPLISNIRIDLQGDTATSQSTCVAITAALRGGETILSISALRNYDEHARTSEGWRIKRREKIDLWTTEMPATSALAPS